MSTSEPRVISIFDATLRDGEQAPGNAMSPAAKLRYALLSEAFGSDVVETGFPGSSDADREATRMISQALTRARYSTFNRCSERDILLSVEAAGTGPRHQVAICGTGSDLHLRHKRGISRQDAVDEASTAVRLAASLGVSDIAFCVEDASRGDHAFLTDLIRAAVDAGATTVGLADTTGCATPAEYGALIAAVRAVLPPSVVLSTHCHDDLGLALANALAGIEAGADEVQVTMAGIGERCGNTALEEIAAVLAFKGDQLNATTALEIDQLYAAYLDLARSTGLATPRHKAVFGLNAFATQAGIHQAGMLRHPSTYEFMDPARWGRQRSLLVGRHSGRAVLRTILDQLDRSGDEALVERLYGEFIADRPGAECDEVDDLRRIIRERINGEVVR